MLKGIKHNESRPICHTSKSPQVWSTNNKTRYRWDCTVLQDKELNFSAGLTPAEQPQIKFQAIGANPTQSITRAFSSEFLVPSWKMLCRMDITVKLGKKPWHWRIGERWVGSLFLGSCGSTTSLHRCGVRKEKRKEKRTLRGKCDLYRERICSSQSTLSSSNPLLCLHCRRWWWWVMDA